MKEVTKKRAVRILMLLLVVFATCAFAACTNTDNSGDKGKSIGLTIEYIEQTWYDGDTFEVPGYKTEAEGASVSVSYTIDGGGEILALVGSSVDLYAGEYVFTYKATLAGYTPEEKTISFTVQEAGEDPLQTVVIDGFTGPVYKTDVFAMSEFTVPAGSVSEGSTLKITMTDPQGAEKTVAGGDKVAINHSGDYVFTYEAVHSNPSYKNKKIDLTVSSTYQGLVGDFEDFSISKDVAVTGFVTIQSQIKHDGENALRLRTSGGSKWPWNRPQVEQVNYENKSKFGTVAADANTVSFWIYPTTDDVLLLSLGFCHSDNWLTWHKDREFKNSAILIGSLTPNEWQYVSLPLPEQFNSTVFGYGLTHFGVYVLRDKTYDTYYNYRDLSDIGGDGAWRDDNGTEHKNSDDFWAKGPTEEVLTYIDSVCFTNDPDWNCDMAFKTVAPTVTKQYQTHTVDYLAQSYANISVTYAVKETGADAFGDEISVDDSEASIQENSEITLAKSGTYRFTYKVLDREDNQKVIYQTTQQFDIEPVSNAITITGYEGTDYTDTKDTLGNFTVPAGTAQQDGATVSIKMTDPKGAETTVTAGSSVELELVGNYVFTYTAEYNGTELGHKTLTITSRYLGLVADFENYNVPGGEPYTNYIFVSTEQAHDGAKSLKFMTRKSSDPSQNGWPWNRPRVEAGGFEKPAAGVNTVSFWIYPTTSHRLLLNLGFTNGNRKNALMIGSLTPNEWHYVSLPLPNEITVNMDAYIDHFGIYVLDDAVKYDYYYSYQDEAGVCNEGNGPNLGPDANVTVYLDTLCFTNDPNWNCDKAFKPVAPTVSEQYQTYTVNYRSQIGAVINVSYTVNGGDTIEVDDASEPIKSGSKIFLSEAGKYVFTFTVKNRAETEVLYTTTTEFDVAASSRVVAIKGWETTDYTGHRTVGSDFTVPEGESLAPNATVNITVTAPGEEATAVTAGDSVTLSKTGDYTFTYEVISGSDSIGSNTLTIHSYNGLVTDFENFTVGGGLPGSWVTVSEEQAHGGTKSLKLISSGTDSWPWNRPRLEQWSGTTMPVYAYANTISFWIYPTTDHKLLLNIDFGDNFQNNALKIGDLTKNQWNFVSLRLPENFTSDKFAERRKNFGVYVLSDGNAYDKYYNSQDDSEIFKKGPNENVTVYIDDLCFTVEEYND